MQVRSIGDDGKIWVNSDSMLPTTLIGHKVKLFSEDPSDLGNWRVIKGGTIEAIGAIHFADPKLRSGDSGIKGKMMYLELHIHGKDKKKQVEALGIRPGDPIIYDRPIEKGFAPDTFSGAYLDNGLGCFVTAEIARLIAESSVKNVRYLAAMASHEEIGRFGIAMGEGYTLTHGAVMSAQLNSIITQVSGDHGIPVQHELAGRDSGTDAMAAVLAAIDSASASIGFPIRNMHTISESGHTGDVDAAIHALYQTIVHMDGRCCVSMRRHFSCFE